VDIGIIGLPGSGKTTLLNALTRAQAQTGGYAGARPNLGVIKVPDPRLDTLTVLMKSARKVQAEISFVDIPGQPPEMGSSQGFQGEYLLQARAEGQAGVAYGALLPLLDKGFGLRQVLLADVQR